MKKAFRKYFLNLLIILAFGVVPGILCQFFTSKPISRNIHIRNFRYGKDPSVIRCNRGDTLRLSFSTDDTGHSFYLEEFDIDAKVSPARNVVEVFKVSDPTQKSVVTNEIVLIARHRGLANFLVSRSNYRCHVWCGPMHAFEHGKLVIIPNTLLVFSLGCSISIVLIWLLSFRTKARTAKENKREGYHDVLEKSGFLRRLVKSRWPQVMLIMLAMVLVYVVILTSIFGTKMSGRNLGVLLMWAIWLFLLIAVLTPFLGRIWCSICPLPFFGDLIQRGSAISPIEGEKSEYKNKYSGLFLKWPHWLRNSWAKLILLMALTTFSTTLVALPKVTGFAVIALLVLPTILSLIFEHRAFCRYLCPVSGFLGPFSRMSSLALRNKSQQTCDRCKAHFCEKGSPKGWACPYGLNAGNLEESNECGLCLECTRSCMYNNVTLYRRPFGSELGTRNLSEAWLAIGIFTLAIVYSVLYQGHWAVVRDYVNILDKGNWGLFAIYAIIVWSTALLIMPGIIYGLAVWSRQLSTLRLSSKEIFLGSVGSLLPLGLMLWISFVIPMLFVNVTFVAQSLSDPFGWGWDFFGTANIPWHQLIPRAVPWMQAILILTGLQFSLRNLKRTFSFGQTNKLQWFLATLPMALFLLASSVALLYFFTN